MILVDWGGGSDAIYSQAAANTRLVGLEVAHLVQAIMVGSTDSLELVMTM